MSGWVNIGRTDDPAYRYKMPRVIGKVEGRGNGIKTVIVNIMELGLALHRDPDEVNKFMGCELGAQTIFNAEQERAIVNGAHKDDVLQDLVNLYVDKFVLCPTCKYPETSYKFKLKKDEIYHSCKACGASDPLIDEGHRLCKFILNKEKAKSDSGKAGKKARKERKRAAAAAAAAAAAEASSPGTPGGDSPTAADKEAKKKAKKEKKKAKKEKKKAKKAEKKKKKAEKKKKKKKKKKNGSNSGSGSGSDSSSSKASGEADSDGEVWASEGAAPMVHDTTVKTSSPAEAMTLASNDLAGFIAQGMETRRVIDKLHELQVNYQLKPSDRCGILFTGVFSGCKAASDFLAAFQRFKTFFRQLVAGQDIEVMAAFDRHFTSAAYGSTIAVVPLLLQLFNEDDIVSDDTIRQWHTSSDPVSDSYGMVEVGGLPAVKAKANAFVEGLDDSDSSSSSDSD